MAATRSKWHVQVKALSKLQRRARPMHITHMPARQPEARTAQWDWKVWKMLWKNTKGGMAQYDCDCAAGHGFQGLSQGVKWHLLSAYTSKCSKTSNGRSLLRSYQGPSALSRKAYMFVTTPKVLMISVLRCRVSERLHYSLEVTH